VAVTRFLISHVQTIRTRSRRISLVPDEVLAQYQSIDQTRTKVVPAAWFTDAKLFYLAICRAVNLSLESGNSDGSCVAYVCFPMIAGPHFGNYKAGFRFGRLGYELVEQRGLKRFQATCWGSGIPPLTLCFVFYFVSTFGGVGTALAQQQPISVDLPGGKDVKVYTFTGIPAAQMDITIVCQGPNAVYYHTEGNPPGFGKNDNGVIQPRSYKQYTLTAATFYKPKVYLTSKFGPTKCGILFGKVDKKTISKTINF
jgi:hypothetical protein